MVCYEAVGVRSDSYSTKNSHDRDPILFGIRRRRKIHVNDSDYKESRILHVTHVRLQYEFAYEHGMVEVAESVVQHARI
jgi:hypothetical protein